MRYTECPLCGRVVLHDRHGNQWCSDPDCDWYEDKRRKDA
jgi:hypothetical protein